MPKLMWLRRTVYWLAWPISWLTLRRSVRTRVLIHSQGQMVVVENWLGTGRWSLPGGGVKRDESPVQAARREVYEEVGLMIDPARLRSLGEYTQRDHGLQFRYELFIVALPQRTALTPRPVEIRRAAWLKPSDIEEEMIGPSVREALRHWPA